MPQSDGVNDLKRFKLEAQVNGTTYYYNFLINPDNYTETHPQRVTAFKTREANVVEDFGPDLGRIQFSGTTGFRRALDSDGQYRSGAERLYHLQEFINRYAESGNTTEPGANPNSGVMYFYNQTDDKSWRVTLDEDGLEIERTAQESLLIRYTLNFIILDTADNPDPRDVQEPIIGDRITDYEDYKTATEYANEGENYQDGTIYDGAGDYNPYQQPSGNTSNPNSTTSQRAPSTDTRGSGGRQNFDDDYDGTSEDESWSNRGAGRAEYELRAFETVPDVFKRTPQQQLKEVYGIDFGD